MGKIKDKINDLNKEILRPNAQVTNIKNVHNDLITSIQEDAIDNFIADFRISNLFQREEEGFIKFVPVISLIISVITLIIVIVK